VLRAAPPADKLTESLDARLAPAQGVASYEFSPPRNSRGGPVVLSVRGGNQFCGRSPWLRPPTRPNFRRASMLRARGAVVLVILVLVFFVYAWRERRGLAERLFAIALALVIAALVPWNTFSNASRIFDPAYYFSKLAAH